MATGSGKPATAATSSAFCSELEGMATASTKPSIVGAAAAAVSILASSRPAAMFVVGSTAAATCSTVAPPLLLLAPAAPSFTAAGMQTRLAAAFAAVRTILHS